MYNITCKNCGNVVRIKWIRFAGKDPQCEKCSCIINLNYGILKIFNLIFAMSGAAAGVGAFLLARYAESLIEISYWWSFWVILIIIATMIQIL